MKINEILREDVNSDTGTPNPDPKPSTWDRLKNKASDIGQGIKQGASQIGQGIKQGTQQVANVAGRVPGAIEKGVQGYNQSYDDATAAGRDNRYGIEKGIAGAKGAVQGYKQSYDDATAAGRDNRFGIQKAAQAVKPASNWIKPASNWIKNKYNNAQGARVAGENLKAAEANWEKYTKQLASFKDMGDPATYQAELDKWAKSLYPSAFANGQQPADINKVKPVKGILGGTSTGEYIMKVVNASAAARALRKGTGDKLPTGGNEIDAKAGADGTQKTPAGIVVPQSVGGGARKNPQQGTATPSNAQSTAPGPDAHDDADIKHDLAPGVQIVSQDPIIVKYKNKEYGLNDAGQWVHFGTSRVPHESFQSFLDRQAGY